MQFSFEEQPFGPLKLFREREKGMAYTIGVDASTGLADDFSSIQVFSNTIPFEQVAVFRERWPVNEVTAFVNKLGYYYNEALIVCEINYPGNSVQDALLEFYRYPRNYQSEMHLDVKTEVTSKYGFRTTENTKWLLIHEALLSMQADQLILHDEQTIDEMRNFVYKDSSRKSGASEGFNDDTVIAMLLAHHGAHLFPYMIQKREPDKIKTQNPDARKAWRDFKLKFSGMAQEPQGAVL
jgi:hypothetical protein